MDRILGRSLSFNAWSFKISVFVRSLLQEIDGAFQKSIVLWKLRMSGIFCGNFHRSEINFSFFSSLAHISIHMVHFSLVQLPVYSFPNWNGNTDISLPVARPSYSVPALNFIGCFFFLSFLFTTNTIDYRFWKQLFIWLGLNVKF